VIKADYGKIASFYDRGRTLSEKTMTERLDLICRYAGVFEKPRVLDLGCGTGRFALPMDEKPGYAVTGLDASPEMLEKAKAKDSGCRVNWVLGNAVSLDFPNAVFDLVFMSHLIHHLDEPIKALRQCHRVLEASGVILLLYGAMDQIQNDVEHTFFPEAVQIDEARTPTRMQVEKWLHQAGFSEIFSEEIFQKTYERAKDRLEGVKIKKTSVLTLISEEAFQSGLLRFSEYLENHPDDPWLLFDKLTITTGIKRS
jgi:ubiquinone/menaquinone biosynthesis C-methylase UbiE